MKKFTKVLASFCAMAMIFSVFSATVAADEETSSEQTTAETVVDEKEEPKVPEAPGSAEPEEDQDKQEEEPENEQEVEKPAEQASEQGAEQGSEQPAAKSGNVSGDSSDIESEVINLPFVPAKNAPKTVLTVPAVAEPFANGQITQADINLNEGKLPVESGTYKLAQSISVSETTVFDVDGAEITLDLNGFDLTYTGTTGLFIVGATDGTSVSAAVKLTITDSSDTPGTITATNTTKGNTDFWISCNNNATALTTGTNANRGGCILIRNSSEVVLEKVTISNFHAEDEGGAIQASNGSFFTMKSGKITNCSAKVAGGAIAGHAASNGTTVNGMNLVSTVRIEGGELSGNSARAGSAVRILRCNYYMTGGVITNNTATGGSGEAGGALFISKIKRNPYIEMSGNPQIYGNNCSEDSKKADLFFYDKTTIHVVGNLDASAKLVFAGADINNNFFDISNATYSMNSFISNHDGYIAYVSGDYIKLKQGVLPKVAGYVIGIGGEIYFKTYVDFASAAQSDVAISYSYVYNKNGTETTISKDVTSYASDAKGDYFIIPVESACMTADITITLTYDNRNTDYETTVEDVANSSVSINSSYADLVKALLTYGGYAQKQLKINTDKLPVVSGVDFDTAPDYGLTTATYSPASDPASAFKGGNVSFLSKTEVKFRFLKSALGDTAPAMTVTYAGGTKTVQGEVSGNYVIYTIKGADEAGFVASRYNESFSFSVGSVSGEYSIYTYLQVINGTGSQPMKNLAQAYYNFAIEAAKIA